MMTHEEIKVAIERLRKLHTYNALEAVNAVIPDGPWADGLIELLEQADPDTHMELPKDADGMPIHIGEELCGHGYPSGGAYCMAINSKDIIFVSELGVSYKDMLLWDPKDCRHYHKPTVEDVLVDYYKECQLHASELGFVTDEGKEKAWRDIATAFADKLRKVMADDETR